MLVNASLDKLRVMMYNIDRMREETEMRTIDEIKTDLQDAVERRASAKQFSPEFFQAVADVEDVGDELYIAERKANRTFMSVEEARATIRQIEAFDNDPDFQLMAK